MKKVLLLVLLSMTIIIIFVGCSSNELTETQIQDDVIAQQTIQNCYESDFIKMSEYKIIDFDITKRQTNKRDKEDIIYCDCTIENDYFQISLSLYLNYNYYDEGGWELDITNIISKEVAAISSPDSQLILDEIKKNNYFHYTYNSEYGMIFDYTNISVEKCDFDRASQTATINIYLQTDVLDLYGIYNLSFAENGWNIDKHTVGASSGVVGNEHYLMCVDSYTTHFDMAIGDFCGQDVTYYPYDIVEGKILTIEEVFDTTIKYSFNGNEYVEKFNPFEGSFLLKNGSKEYNLKWNSRNNIWVNTEDALNMDKYVKV